MSQDLVAVVFAHVFVTFGIRPLPIWITLHIRVFRPANFQNPFQHKLRIPRHVCAMLAVISNDVPMAAHGIITCDPEI